MQTNGEGKRCSLASGNWEIFVKGGGRFFLSLLLFIESVPVHSVGCGILWDNDLKMKTNEKSQGYHVIAPEALHWRPSNLMKIPNADYLERTGSENLGARLWRLPPKSANTLHKHIRSEEFYFVLEGTGRLRVGGETLTVPKYGGVWVGPTILRQVFNDTDADTLWLIIGGPEEKEFLQGSNSRGIDLSLFYPEDPTQLPPELSGVSWPPRL